WVQTKRGLSLWLKLRFVRNTHAPTAWGTGAPKNSRIRRLHSSGLSFCTWWPEPSTTWNGTLGYSACMPLPSGSSGAQRSAPPPVHAQGPRQLAQSLFPVVPLPLARVVGHHQPVAAQRLLHLAMARLRRGGESRVDQLLGDPRRVVDDHLDELPQRLL